MKYSHSVIGGIQ